MQIAKNNGLHNNHFANALKLSIR